jgi:hypothetical protein
MGRPTTLRNLRWAIAAMFLFLYLPARVCAVDMTSTLFIGKAQIDVVVENNGVILPTDEILRWVETAARAVQGYYGAFPVPYVSVHITAFHGSGVHGGMTFGAEEGGRIIIRVGDKTPESYFKSDWMMTHEMVHLAFPSVADRHHWIEEGIATYVEPIARVRAGELTPEKMWEEVTRDMPQGLPEPGDRGLDRTHTWGRTYWGGAIFCLLADIQIRRQTKDKKGLEDALRAVLQAGGDIRESWELSEAFKIGDRATGTHVLENLYKEMKEAPVPVDLNGIWTELGVRIGKEGVTFDEEARFAATRRAIVSPPQSVSQENLTWGTSTILAGRTARHSLRRPASS